MIFHFFRKTLLCVDEYFHIRESVTIGHHMCVYVCVCVRVTEMKNKKRRRQKRRLHVFFFLDVPCETVKTIRQKTRTSTKHNRSKVTLLSFSLSEFVEKLKATEVNTGPVNKKVIWIGNNAIVWLFFFLKKIDSKWEAKSCPKHLSVNFLKISGHHQQTQTEPD